MVHQGPPFPHLRGPKRFSPRHFSYYSPSVPKLFSSPPFSYQRYTPPSPSPTFYMQSMSLKHGISPTMIWIRSCFFKHHPNYYPSTNNAPPHIFVYHNKTRYSAKAVLNMPTPKWLMWISWPDLTDSVKYYNIPPLHKFYSVETPYYCVPPQKATSRPLSRPLLRVLFSPIPQ